MMVFASTLSALLSSLFFFLFFFFFSCLLVDLRNPGLVSSSRRLVPSSRLSSLVFRLSSLVLRLSSLVSRRFASSSTRPISSRLPPPTSLACPRPCPSHLCQEDAPQASLSGRDVSLRPCSHLAHVFTLSSLLQHDSPWLCLSMPSIRGITLRHEAEEKQKRRLPKT